MALINCKECNQEISQTAKTCPNCGAKNKKTPGLAVIGVFIVGVIILGNMFDSSSPVPATATKNNNTNYNKISFDNIPKTNELEVSSWSCYEKHGYMIVEGEVKNISNFPIENLRAIGNFREEDGTFVKSDDGLVEYSPLLPNQESLFKVMSRHNPAIVKCRISFKDMSGQKILHKDLKNEK